MSHALAFSEFPANTHYFSRRMESRRIHEAIRFFVCLEQRFYRPAQSEIAFARLVQVDRALARRQRQRRVKHMP